MDLRKAVPLLLAWIAAVCGAILFPLSESLPFRLGPARPAGAFVAFVQVQVLFLVLAWPLTLGTVGVREAMGRLGALLALGLPPALVAADVSGEGAGALLRAQALAASFGAFAAALFGFAGPAAGPWYYLGAFLLSAGVPFAAFLSREFGGPDLAGLSILSPAWGATRPSYGQALLFGAAALALLAALRFLRREVDAPARPG